MSGLNVGQLNVGIGMSTEQMEIDAKNAQASVDQMMSGIGGAVEKLKAQLNFDAALDGVVEKFRAAELAARPAIERMSPSEKLKNMGPGYKRDPMIEALDKWTSENEAAAHKANEIDRERWLLRARMRDKDLKDEIQSKNLEVIAAEEAERKKAAFISARVKTANIIAQVRGQQASRTESDAMMLAMQQEAQHLRWSMMTEKEKFAVRKQADLEHLAMLRQFQAITDADFAKLSQRAGTLGLGSTPGDNNMRNTGFRGAMIAQQLGFGVQDFMSQMTNAKTAVDGMGRGIMALSNNVQMMGAAWGSTALATTAIGGALVGIIVPAMINWLSNSKEVEQRMKKIEEAAKETATALAGGIGTQVEMGRKGTAEEQLSTLEKINQEIVDSEKRMQQMRRWAGSPLLTAETKKALEEEIEKERKKGLSLELQYRLGATDAFGQDVEDQIVKNAKKEKDVRDQIKKDKEREEENVVIVGEERDRLREEREGKKRAAKAALDKQILEENKRQFGLREQIDALRDQGSLTPAGPSAMSIAGTSAAASAINRALSGSRSEESDRKKQIKIMEDQLKSSQRIEQKLNLAKADLGAA